MVSLIQNEIFKVVKQRKLLYFMGLLLFVTLIFAVGANYIDEAPVEISGQNFPLLLLNALTGILPILLIFFVVDMTTQEYLSGTLKLPLLYPVSRKKLLLAKIITLLIIIILLLAFALLAGYVIGTAVFGWGNYVNLDNILLTYGEGLKDNLQSYGLAVLPLFSLSLLFLLVSMQAKGIGSAIGVSLAILFLLSVSGDLFTALKPYSLYTYLSFHMVILARAHTAEILFGFFIIVIYGLLAFALNMYYFERKDLLY